MLEYLIINKTKGQKIYYKVDLEYKHRTTWMLYIWITKKVRKYFLENEFSAHWYLSITKPLNVSIIILLEWSCNFS